MQFKNYILYTLIIYLLISCSKNDDENRVEDFFYFRNEGADMPVHVEGFKPSKTIVILLHGGPGGDSHIYNTGLSYFSDMLEEKYMMVYYDQRGSGTSIGKFSKDKLNIDQYVEDLDILIKILMEKYGSDNDFYLMGHSWGGTLGTAYLLNSNEENNIAGWIEVDGAHKFNTTPELVRLFNQVGNDQINKDNSTDFWKEVMDYCSDIDTNNVTDIQFTELNEYGYKAEEKLYDDEEIVYDLGSETLVGYLAGVTNHYLFSGYDPLTAWTNLRITSSGLGMFHEVKDIDYTSQLHNITIPTLILWGRYDMVVPLENGEEAYNLIGTEEKDIFIFEQSGHSPMVTAPDEFVRQVSRFINRYKK